MALRSGITSISGLPDASNTFTSTSRLRAVSFQCTRLSSSPSCHLRISTGEAVSSAARRMLSGPASTGFRISGAVFVIFGRTSTFTSLRLSLRERTNSPNMSVTVNRTTPA